jgi:hypothetical protein
VEPLTIATIATGAITALQPFVTKGLEKLAEKTAEEGFNERKAIWEKVKGLFKADDLTLLNLLEEANANDKVQGKLEGKLETYLEANPAIVNELSELVKRLEELEKNNPAPKKVSNIENKDISNSFVINEVNQS